MEQLAATIRAGKKEITVYRDSEASASAPTVYLNAGDDEGAATWEACRSIGCPAFTLAVIAGLQWNHDLTPWPMPPIWKNDTPYTGGADDYLALLTGEILPAVEETLGETGKSRCTASSRDIPLPDSSRCTQLITRTHLRESSVHPAHFGILTFWSTRRATTCVALLRKCIFLLVTRKQKRRIAICAWWKNGRGRFSKSTPIRDLHKI